MFFHEQRYSYPKYEADLSKSGLRGANLWKEVQDFKWIRKEKSPNFTLIFDGKEQAPVEEQASVIYNPTNAAPAHYSKPEDVVKTQKQPNPVLDDLQNVHAAVDSKPAIQAPIQPVDKLSEAKELKEDKKLPSYHQAAVNNPNPPQTETKPPVQKEQPKPATTANEDDEIDEI